MHASHQGDSREVSLKAAYGVTMGKLVLCLFARSRQCKQCRFGTEASYGFAKIWHAVGCATMNRFKIGNDVDDTRLRVVRGHIVPKDIMIEFSTNELSF